MRIESENLRCAVRIERQIQARAYADLQHTALGQPDGSLSIGCELPVPHRKIHKMRQDVLLVDSHHLSPKATFQNRGYVFSPLHRVPHAVSHELARVTSHSVTAAPVADQRSGHRSSPVQLKRAEDFAAFWWRDLLWRHGAR